MLGGRWEIFRNERGATIAIVAIAMVALIAVVALVVDIGQFYLVRSRLQAAADSAVLAAAQDLAEQRSRETAMDTAESYADDNFTAAHQATVTFPASREINVRIQANEATFFGPIFGLSSVSISAAATAGYDAVSSVRDTVPIIVPFQLIEGHVGDENITTFELGADHSDAGQRGFFWLVNFTDEGAGTPVYSDWIINGYPGAVEVGMLGNGEGMKAALDAALEERMNTDPSVIVPLYDFTEASGGNKNYHVVGFAEFVITGFNFQGQPKTISGYFTTGTVVEGETDVDPPVDYGINAVRLKG